MRYRVIFQRRAEVQFYDSANWWAEHRSREQAARWIEAFQSAINGLEFEPDRHSLARENDKFTKQLRQLLFGLGRRPTHRAIFYIEGDEVHVVSVRHVAQADLSDDDL